ncbi:MAG: hypothetical protein RSC30_06870, partial [Oscillospiraceae bacterium]
EMINQVLEAEKSAAAKEQVAKNTATEIIKSAESEAKSTLDSMKLAAAKEKDQIIAKAQKAAEEIFSKAEADAEAQSQELLNQSKAKLGVSIETVVKHVIP